MNHRWAFLSSGRIQNQQGAAKDLDWCFSVHLRPPTGFVVCSRTHTGCPEGRSTLYRSSQRSRPRAANRTQRSVFLCLAKDRGVVQISCPRAQLAEAVLVARQSEKKLAEEKKKSEHAVEEKRAFGPSWKFLDLLGSPASAFWFLMGIFIVFLNVLRRLVRRKKAENVPIGSEKYRAESDEELHVYRCGQCGYTLYPARGRELKFFPKTFKCPQCSAPKSEFWDLNDPNDPRNQETDEEHGSVEPEGSSSDPEPPTSPPSGHSEEPPSDKPSS
ncbi:hypothetical protein F1559_002394 [Cyanidiococcus yangmingshanensis]|uniref:Rubredoxin-like domain-containing protein n=1 Tax=Cyanidiococcus yangmingshanensis TaxID=2690220 RepID=A0A7J7IMV8_9RHOD|nr:hypothetical protein F1559_002394 [Cyanidiococcus yangmingshanensis]